MYQFPINATSFGHLAPPTLPSSVFYPDDSSYQQFAASSSSFPYAPIPRYHNPREYIAVAVSVVHIGAIRINEHIQKIPMVGRVSIVDYRGNAILDTYVRPTHHIEDFRTDETGLQYSHLANAPHFQDVQLRVSNIIHKKIIVGHSLWDFLSVLGLSHPALQTRDLALFRPLRQKLKSRSIISLPTLINLFMGRNIGLDYEDPLEMSRGSMDLFRCCEELFERTVASGAWPCNLPPSTYAKYFT